MKTLTTAAALAASAFAAACLFSGSANAADQRVAYGDLDLTSATGVATLDSRIDNAARNLCWDRGRRDVACRIAVREEALEKIAVSQQSRTSRAEARRETGQRPA